MRAREEVATVMGGVCDIIRTEPMRTIHISRDGSVLGVYTESEALERWRAGDYADTDWAWCEGMAEWVPLGEFAWEVEEEHVVVIAPPPREEQVAEEVVSVEPERSERTRMGWRGVVTLAIVVVVLAAGLVALARWVDRERAMPRAVELVAPVAGVSPSPSATPVRTPEVARDLNAMPGELPPSGDTAELWSGVEDGTWVDFAQEGLRLRVPVAMDALEGKISEGQRSMLRDRVIWMKGFYGKGDSLIVTCTVYQCEAGTPLDLEAVVRDAMETIRTAYHSQTGYTVEDVSLRGQEIRGVDVVLDGERTDYGVKVVAWRAGWKVAVVTVMYQPHQDGSLERANHVLASMEFRL